MQRAPFLQQTQAGVPQQQLPATGSFQLPGINGQAAQQEAVGGTQQQDSWGSELPTGQVPHIPLPGLRQNVTILNNVGNTKLYLEHYPHVENWTVSVV